MALFGLLLVLIFGRYVLQVGFPRVILLAVIAMIAMAGSRDQIIAMIFCCLPLHTSVSYIAALGICFVAYFVKYPKDFGAAWQTAPIILLFFWEMIHGFDGYTSTADIVIMFAPLAICMMLLCRKSLEFDYIFIVRTLAVCTAFMCFTVLCKVLIDTGFDIGTAFLQMERLGMMDEEQTITGAYFNPNVLGYYCILASTGPLQLIAVRKYRRIDVVLVVILLVCGVLTLSRTFLVCLLLMALLFFFAMEGKGKIRFLAGGVIITSVGILVLWLVFPSAVESFWLRFQVDDVGAGRSTIFSMYHDYLMENPITVIFGVGIQQFSEKVLTIYNVCYQVPHNGTQEVVVVWGIPGLVIMIAFVGGLISRAKRSGHRLRLLHYIPLILLLTKVQAGQLVTSECTMLMFSLAFLSLCYDFYGTTSRKEGLG